MCPEIMALKGSNVNQKDMDATSVNRRWSKSKRKPFFSTHMRRASLRNYSSFVERRQRIRACPARKSHQARDPGDISSGRKHCSVPSGAMAPKNTTQYLMDLVYAEQSDVSMEPYDRDFESVFFRNEI